jgi:hypothetical protein
VARKSKSDEPKRKIGQRTEIVTVKLSPMQIEDQRALVIDLIQEGDELEERLKSSKADYKAKIAEVDSKKSAALGAVRSGKVAREIIVEEWVPERNEVIRIDQATGEEVGRRNATARELQEELPIDTTPPAKASEADGEDMHAAEVAEDEAGEGDDFGDRAS